MADEEFRLNPAPETSGSPRVSRRTLLVGTGVAAGAVWVAPTILTASAAAAASALATVTFGTFQHVQGNNNATVDLPVGTVTQYILIVAEVTTASGSTGFLPTLNPGSGFTLISSDSAAPAPNFAVYKSAAGTAAPVLTGNDTKGRWTAVVIGFSVGTTVTASGINATPASPLVVTGATAPVASTWVLITSASDGVGPNNWTTPGGYTKVLDIDGNNQTPPDLFVAKNNSLLVTVPSVSASFAGLDSAKGVLVGVG